MGGHTKAGHVYANNSNAIDFFGQELQRHTACGRHAEINNDERIKVLGIGLGVDRLANILKEFARDKRLGIKGHITHGSSSAIKMRCEGKAIDTAGTARQDGGRAAHAQTDTQRAKGRAHALGLVVGALGIIFGVLVKGVGLASGFRGGMKLLLVVAGNAFDPRFT